MAALLLRGAGVRPCLANEVCDERINVAARCSIEFALMRFCALGKLKLEMQGSAPTQQHGAAMANTSQQQQQQFALLARLLLSGNTLFNQQQQQQQQQGTSVAAAGHANWPTMLPTASSQQQFQQRQQPVAFPNGRKYWKYHIQRMQTAASHIMFYLVASDGSARLVVVGTDHRGTGHFVYSSIPSFTEATPLRCTNRTKVSGDEQHSL